MNTNESKFVIVSDGTSTIALLNGQYFGPGVEEIAFQHKSAESCEVTVGINSLSRVPSGGGQDFWDHASAILGYELRPK